MDLARAHALESIAFPAISTGIYGYPLEDATKVAIATIRDEAEKPGAPQRVIIACFNQAALDAYHAAGVEGE